MIKLFDSKPIEPCSFPQLPQADATARRRIDDPSNRFSGVYRYYDRYQSRVCIGGVQHTLATGCETACLRMTDAALLYFWGYRKRPSRGPLDTDFNIGIDSARYDLEHCAWLQTFLYDVEQVLALNGLINLADKKTIIAKPGFDRARFLIKWNAFFDEHRLMLDELRRAGEPAKLIHSMASEHFDAYAKCIDTADRAILKPRSIKSPDSSLDQAL